MGPCPYKPLDLRWHFLEINLLVVRNMWQGDVLIFSMCGTSVSVSHKKTTTT